MKLPCNHPYHKLYHTKNLPATWVRQGKCTNCDHSWKDLVCHEAFLWTAKAGFFVCPSCYTQCSLSDPKTIYDVKLAIPAM